MIDEDKPKFKKVKYRQHGILAKHISIKTGENLWTFETSGISNEYSGEGFDLVTILDSLSEEGFELVTGHDDEYILRTKDEIEYEQEYFTDDEEDDD
jgi:tRNA G26 N,N-dimethylase Trm1